MGSLKKNRRYVALFIFVYACLFYSAASATETNVIVRALAKDAMFIGTSMGGASIIIRDVENGIVLARGRTEGGTGNSVTVMKEPRTRHRPLSDVSTAKFEASIDLTEPTLVQVEALAPHGQRQARVKVSTQIWLIPGRHIVGDGIILEIPGFAVDVLAPQAAERFRLSETTSVSIKANVVMMCGCPITPGGLWDAEAYEVAGIVKHNGVTNGTIALAYAKKTSTFSGRLKVCKPGIYEIQIYAYDTKTGKTGLDTVVFKVQE